MKYLLPFVFVLFLLPACHNKSKTKEAAKDSVAEQVVSPDIQNRLEQMKDLSPLQAEKIRAMFPEDLEGMKLSDYSAINNEGYEAGEGSYQSEDGKQLNVTILDCVGEAGVGKYNLMYLGYLGADSKEEDSYRKTIDFKGDKAIESYDKNEDKYSLLFPSGKRLLVKIEGERTGPDAVKQAAGSLNLKTN